MSTQAMPARGQSVEGLNTNIDIQSLDERRLYVSTLIYSLICVPVLLVFAVLDFIAGSIQLGSVLLANALFTLFIQILTIFKKNITYIKNVSVLQITAISIYLVVTGGHDGTGLLWTFLVPNITFFILGFTAGTAFTVLYIVTVGVFFFIVDTPMSYSIIEMSRYLAAYCAVSLFAAGFEYSRALTVKQLHNVNERFKALAISDPLTKLLNRNGFHSAIEKITPLLKRNNAYLTVLVLDLDNFKQINDQYGHAAGDLVITRVADVIATNLRENDIAARWGGEEFLVFLPATAEQGAVHVAEKIRCNVNSLIVQWKDHVLNVSVSIGVAASRTTELEKLISIADKKLYQAKDKRGDSVVV